MLTSFAVFMGLAMRIATHSQPPQILQIYREPLKPGSEAAYRKIEEDTARLSAKLGCPHPSSPSSPRRRRGIPTGPPRGFGEPDRPLSEKTGVQPLGDRQWLWLAVSIAYVQTFCDLLRVKFDNLEEARRALLCDAATIARSSTEPFAVVGGWSPFLLNSAPIKHPGTVDVDLLFAEAVTPGRLQRAYRLFLDAGYCPSAKHEFQLVRLTTVGTQELAFNVDILHPHEQTRRDPFVDHIELPVPMTPFIKRHLKMKSVAVPASRFIFAFNRIAEVDVEGIINLERLENAYYHVPVVEPVQVAEMVRVLELFARYISNSWKRMQLPRPHLRRSKFRCVENSRPDDRTRVP